MNLLVSKTMQKQVGCGAGSSVSNNFVTLTSSSRFALLVYEPSMTAYVLDVQDTK